MKQVIHTLGTRDIKNVGEKRTLNFIQILSCHKIDAVIDVRLRNEGRYYKFASGKNIKRIARSLNIAYVHDKIFAPTPEMLTAWKKNQDWEEYEAGYKQLILDRDMFSAWKEVTSRFKRPLLLCAEKRGDKCHRNLLAENLVNNYGESQLVLLPMTEDEQFDAFIQRYKELG